MSVGMLGKRGLYGFFLLLMILSAGCTTNNSVKVGIESNFRPFTYTEAGEGKGFEVELWQAIAEKANLKYELIPMEYRELNEAVKSGKVDLAIAGMTINNARKEKFAFSDPYFQTGLVILTASDNETIKTEDDLAGKVVATRLGSTAYTYTGDIKGIKEIRGFPSITEAYDQLKDKKVDAVVFDERNAHDFIQKSGDGKVKIVGEVLNKESYGVVSKKRNQYIGRVNLGIEAVVKDGTYAALYKKWFGSEPSKLPGE